MPHTICYQEIIDDLITEERLKSYEVTFNTQNDIELLGAYLWNSHVCSALYPLLSATEVALRNAIDKNEFFDSPKLEGIYATIYRKSKSNYAA